MKPMIISISACIADPPVKNCSVPYALKPLFGQSVAGESFTIDANRSGMERNRPACVL